MSATLEGRDILCLASQDWDSHLGVPQQLMARFAERNRVVYVDPARSLRALRQVRTMPADPRTRHLDVAAGREVEVLRPPPMALPGPKLPPALFQPIHRLNAFILGRWLARVVAARGMARPLVWTFLPAWGAAGAMAGGGPIVYDCIDDWAGYYPADAAQHRNTLAMDEALCRAADLLLAGSQSLLVAKSRLNANAHLVRHAADFQSFNRAARAETEVPAAIACLPRPVIGLMGILDKRVDIDILVHVARSRPRWSVALVGPIIEGLDASRLTGLANVHAFGMQPAYDLPRWLKGFDACVIPYVVDQFVRGIYPLKLHEYLASGKPVVSTPIPAVADENADVAAVADGPDAFLLALERELSTDDEGARRRRIERARANTWEARIIEKSRHVLALGPPATGSAPRLQPLPKGVRS